MQIPNNYHVAHSMNRILYINTWFQKLDHINNNNKHRKSTALPLWGKFRKKIPVLYRCSVFFTEIWIHLYAQLLTGFTVSAVVKNRKWRGQSSLFPVSESTAYTAVKSYFPITSGYSELSYVSMSSMMWCDMMRGWPRDLTWCRGHHSEIHSMIHTCFLHPIIQSATESNVTELYKLCAK